MQSRNFIPLVSKINKIRIDFGENEFEDGLRDAAKQFKNRSK